MSEIMDYDSDTEMGNTDLVGEKRAHDQAEEDGTRRPSKRRMTSAFISPAEKRDVPRPRARRLHPGERLMGARWHRFDQKQREEVMRAAQVILPPEDLVIDDTMDLDEEAHMRGSWQPAEITPAPQLAPVEDLVPPPVMQPSRKRTSDQLEEEPEEVPDEQRAKRARTSESAPSAATPAPAPAPLYVRDPAAYKKKLAEWKPYRDGSTPAKRRGTIFASGSSTLSSLRPSRRPVHNTSSAFPVAITAADIAAANRDRPAGNGPAGERTGDVPPPPPPPAAPVALDTAGNTGNAADNGNAANTGNAGANGGNDDDSSDDSSDDDNTGNGGAPNEPLRRPTAPAPPPTPVVLPSPASGLPHSRRGHLTELPNAGNVDSTIRPRSRNSAASTLGSNRSRARPASRASASNVLRPRAPNTISRRSRAPAATVLPAAIGALMSTSPPSRATNSLSLRSRVSTSTSRPSATGALTRTSRPSATGASTSTSRPSATGQVTTRGPIDTYIAPGWDPTGLRTFSPPPPPPPPAAPYPDMRMTKAEREESQLAAAFTMEANHLHEKFEKLQVDPFSVYDAAEQLQKLEVKAEKPIYEVEEYTQRQIPRWWVSRLWAGLKPGFWGRRG
ncbi:MAG: hypothetical protein Q9202_003150 [Teloschistes flavicans]